MTWTRSEIRRARQRPLKPILEALGYQLEPLRNGNYRLCRLAADTCPGVALWSRIVVKGHYWVNKEDGAAACAEQRRSGNAIDFLVDVQGMSFSQAMDLLLSAPEQPSSS